MQLLRQMNSPSEEVARGSAKHNLTINNSFYLFSNVLTITVFPPYPCIAGNLAYKFKKMYRNGRQSPGEGYFHENTLADGLIVWDQEFSNRLTQ